MHDATTLSKNEAALLDEAIRQAKKSLSEGGIPIGCAIGAPGGEIVGAGHNLRVQTGDTTAHAETAAMRSAGRRRDWHTLTMATTLSPCIMCAGAALLHRVPRIIIGKNRTFMGAEDLLCERGVSMIVVQDPRCIEMMETFIREKPELWNEDIGVPQDA